MSTNPFRTAFDRLARTTFGRHGMAERSTEADPARVVYTPVGGVAVPCDAYFDRGLMTVGIDGSQVAVAEIVITVWRDQVGAADPRHGSTFEIVGVTYSVDSVLSGDESRVRVLVKKGT